MQVRSMRVAEATAITKIASSSVVVSITDYVTHPHVSNCPGF